MQPNLPREIWYGQGEHSPEGNLIKGTEVKLPKGLCYLVSYIVIVIFVSLASLASLCVDFEEIAFVFPARKSAVKVDS